VYQMFGLFLFTWADLWAKSLGLILGSRLTHTLHTWFGFV
jgi:hypothetical protein